MAPQITRGAIVVDRRISLIPKERIERAIILVRGEKVMLDADLAKLEESAAIRSADSAPPRSRS